MRDRRLIYAAVFLRALGTGMAGVLLGLHLGRLDLGVRTSNWIIAAGLAGGAVASLLVTLAGDRLGRRRLLVALAALGAAGGLGFLATADPPALAVLAFVGMINGMGRDRGAALILEQAALPATGSDADRTRTFAVYHLLQDAGQALGSLLAGLPAVWTRFGTEAQGFQVSFGVYAGLMGASLLAYLPLSGVVEPATAGARLAVSPESRSILRKICTLFAVDSIAGGFLTTAALSWFFTERFGVGATWVGALFFLARTANALSHLGAAWLARRIGLVNTMVFTHIPSSLLLMTVPFAPSFPVAAILFLLREGLVEMDVPTRQSYVMAVVRPEERTVASGVTHLVRMGGWALAPSFAGLFMAGGALWMPLLVGAGMKIAYDVMLYAAFRGVKPPEEA